MALQKDKPRNCTDPHIFWSEKQRYEAVALYKLLGSLNEVAKQTSIPVQTLRQWHLKDWWRDYELELVAGDRAGLSAKLAKVRDRAIAVVEDRLANGDFHMNPKTGEISRKPLNAGTATKIMSDSIDRSVLIEKLNKEHKATMTLDKINDRLQKLHDTFREMVGNKKRPSTIIDVEPVVEAPRALSEGNNNAETGDSPGVFEVRGDEAHRDVLQEDSEGEGGETASMQGLYEPNLETTVPLETSLSEEKVWNSNERLQQIAGTSSK